MRKTMWIGIGIVAVILIIGGGYALIRLNRGGYLPTGAEVTADPAPTAIPLTATLEETVAPQVAEATDEPSPTVPSPTVTPEATEPAADEITTATPPPTASVTSTPEPAVDLAATRVVALPDEVNVPEGFGISLYADNLLGPRMMTIGPDGEVYVAERGANRIVRLPDRDGDGVADEVEVVADGLSAPSSLDFYQDGSLYVGETTRVLRLTLTGTPAASDEVDVIVDGLPQGGHSTRTVLFSPDFEWLYVSVGSSCNVCVEEDPLRATIVRYRPDGSDETLFATGLRNAVGITFRPGTNELWATNNGRDWLGDDQPPETVYVVEMDDDAGWPQCHSGRIVDPEFGEPGACEGVLDPVIEMQAHTAPLGLGFYTGDQFPEAYRGDLFVGLHGSWNRSVPVGYKVVRIPISDGTAGSVTDFAVGWLRSDGSDWGRPVDVVTAVDGSLLVSDDAGGRIYRIFYAGPR